MKDFINHIAKRYRLKFSQNSFGCRGLDVSEILISNKQFWNFDSVAYQSKILTKALKEAIFVVADYKLKFS